MTMLESAPSDVHGTSEVALLGETIGQRFPRTCVQQPDRDDLVCAEQGYRSRTTTSSTTATSVGATMHDSPEARVCIPVPRYHCFGVVMGNLACIAHGCTMVLVGEAFEQALHVAVRRAHDVHRAWRARPAQSRSCAR